MTTTRPVTFFLGIVAVVAIAELANAATRPNILWITSEDNGPHVGAYGDSFADTPNLDRFASRGLIYLNAWSNAPVCAPARTTIIAGMYAPSVGAEHMRSMTRLPNSMRMYPQYLRAAGYYCTNNSKEDYNLEKPGKVWDESSGRSHWKNRQPGQPFFAIFNHTVSHESQIRKRPHTPVHDPAQVRVPAYHPDVAVVRQDWAQYYDKITEMDARVGRNLKELEEAGLADDTIVFYYGDHGSGMPRSKRWPYNSGLHVPLIVYIPEKLQRLWPAEYQAGGKTDRLVSFVDLAPTALSLAGVEPPDTMQGRAFLGEYATEPREYIFGYRGRMDERYDMVRSVRDKRYVYIRNYMPHRIYGQYLNYMFQTPTTRTWRRLYDESQLQPPRTFFWEEKPVEELYDIGLDPDEVHNLAASSDHQEVLERMRQVHHQWVLRVRDVGFLPEAEIHSRSAGSTPYDMGHDPSKYPLQKILAAAEVASRRDPHEMPRLLELLQDDDSAVRYWAAIGLLNRRAPGSAESTRAELRAALEDTAESVRVLAAEALGRFGNDDDLRLALPVLAEMSNIEQHGVYVSMLALNSLDQLDAKANPVMDDIKRLPRSSDKTPKRASSYVPRLLDKTLADLDGDE